MGLCPIGQKTIIEWQYPGEDKQQIIGADDYSIVPNHVTQARYNWVYDMGLAINVASAYTPSNASLGCNNTRNPVRRCTDEQIISGMADSRKLYSGFYAPIYKYRVSDHAASAEKCIPNGSQPLSIPCGLANGYRKVEILCHGDSFNYRLNPVWLTAWDATRNLPANYLGALLQVPTGGEYPVVYEEFTNRYIGVIPSSYGWQYFYFSPLSSVLPMGYLFKIYKGELVVYQRLETDKPVVNFTCGEKCPPGTCECDCGSIICCYDPATGRAVKQIPK